VSASLDPAAVERALRKAGALRALCRRLPRVLSPHEERLAGELAAFVGGDAAACSDEALFVGMREAFRRKDAALLCEAARRAPERVHAHLDLATWAAWARHRLADSRPEGGRCGGSAPAPPRTGEAGPGDGGAGAA